MIHINENESKIYLDKIKTIYLFKLLVVKIGISKYTKKEINDKKSVFLNVKQMLLDLKQYDIIYHFKEHEIVNDNNDNKPSSISFNQANNSKLANSIS